jgi:molybdopterin/thiamine biosynthesis adenylyltransferase
MGTMKTIEDLTEEQAKIYEWQIAVPGFGLEGQKKLAAASVLISRVGGLGGLVAYELAAAGIGKLVLYHGGKVRPSDLNRQLLMTRDWVGKPRIESIERRLLELNPDLEIVAIGENISEVNAEAAVAQADVVVCAAPLFSERFAMNSEAIRQKKPFVDCAMYEMEAQILNVDPGRTACLRCLYPDEPAGWKRQFPVFGAVSGAIGCMGAMEAIKIIAGFGSPLYGTLLRINMTDMNIRRIVVRRNAQCKICGGRSNVETA